MLIGSWETGYRPMPSARNTSNIEKFILMMSDHIFELDFIKSFIARAKDIKEDELLLAADRRLEEVYDLEECTKIKHQESLPSNWERACRISMPWIAVFL